ncbi:hypothetical protein [Tateyamaria omphalii]|uniref:hypothetical protein n=1 Tax=Tateyamaria omphalii TaxID=299262 RepID=UPI0015617C96|nr:hypothetical protein [Tateyamaria omphalii]
MLTTEEFSEAAIVQITRVLSGNDDCVVITQEPNRITKAANGKGFKYEGCKVRVREQHCMKELNDRTNLDNYKYALKKFG